MASQRACAACQYQRRRCTSDCLFRRYFPADRSQEFQNARRLFGVRNMRKILENMSLELRDEAMISIKFESTIRFNNPVHGCLGVTHELRSQIELAEAELHYVRSQLAKFTSVYNPAAAAGESIRNPSRNVTARYVTGVPVNKDGTIDFFSRGGHSGSLAYGECVTETRPLERTNNAQQFPPDLNNLGSSLANENNANDNDKNAVDFDAALQQFVGAPRNTDNRRLFDFSTDEQRSFFETKESSDEWYA